MSESINDMAARDRGYTPEYNAYGFDQRGYHRDTGTEYDPSGYDRDGYNAVGDDREGYDREGYDCEGYDCEGYDRDGWNCDGMHRDTGTCYDEEGYDVDGNERESDFDDELASYGSDVIAETGYRFPAHSSTMLLAGHEIEMYSDDEDIEHVRSVLHQINDAWRQCNGGTNRRAAIAKHDGSLSAGGFETVTVPLTRDQTYAIFGRFAVLNGGHASVRAWSKGNSVGHHIHVNASAVTAYTTGKLGVFLNHPFNRGFVELIAQRAAEYNGFENEKKLTSLRPRFRHAVLNHTGDTIEFRMFKSNLRTAGILKNYEFAMSSIKFCEQASHSALQWDEYVRWLAKNTGEYEYLSRFIHRDTGWLGRLFRTSITKNIAAKLSKVNAADNRHTA